jgi:AcrR family transcriptional regulator
MSSRTVDWTATRNAPARAEGLRERKKRQMRQQLTDTATEMVVERGFDAVRVVEVAEACGVSEKTVFNYFPTKEALILDHPDITMAALRTTLADPDLTPIEAVLSVLAGELEAFTSWLAQQPDPVETSVKVRRFNTVIETTPSLRAYQRDMVDQLVAAAAEVLADRVGMSADEPEPQIVATALLGLWRIQFASMARHVDGVQAPDEVGRAVTADVNSAARLIATGLAGFAVVAPEEAAVVMPEEVTVVTPARTRTKKATADGRQGAADTRQGDETVAAVATTTRRRGRS